MLMLGNLTVSDIENRIGVILPSEIRNFLLETHQEVANNIRFGKWHCFDIPLAIVCGDMQLAEEINAALQPFSHEFKETMLIYVENKL